MDPGVSLARAGCLLSNNKVTHYSMCIVHLLNPPYSINSLSDCAFGIALDTTPTTSIDPTIETMIECATGQDTTFTQTMQSSPAVYGSIGVDLFKTPMADVDDLISTATAPSKPDSCLSTPKIDGTIAIDATTTPPTPIILPTVGNVPNGNVLFHYLFIVVIYR